MDNLIPLFQGKNITKRFPGTIALDNVSFEVRAGEVHALVGENGAGKSTLMLIMGGVLQPDSGGLFLNGKEIQLRDPSQAKRLGISIVFQELALFPNMSVAENVFTNSQLLKKSGLIDFNEMYRSTRESLQAFGIDVDPQSLLSEYSLGAMQLIEIARAVQQKSKVLLLDEPTSAIGKPETERLFRVIRFLRDHGVGIVYVSHKLDEVFAIADRITVLKDGEFVDTVPTRNTTPDAVVRMMVGKEFDKYFPEREKVTGKPTLELRGLTGKGFSDVDLIAYSGEVMGIFGLTGAGRTELAKAVFGVEPYYSGEILIEGKRVHISSPAAAMHVGVAYIPEERKTEGLFLGMSLEENIAAANLRKVSHGELIIPERLKGLALYAIQELQIKATSVEQPMKYLSGGNQQKVLFAKWLARQPKVLIADEPTRGIDVGAKADIHRLLHELARQGAAVIMISSELPEIMGLSDRIAVMRMGKLVGEFDPFQTTEEEIVSYAAGATIMNDFINTEDDDGK